MSGSKNDDTNPVPWRQGYFKMGEFRAILLQTSGNNKLLWKNLICLDFPDIKADSFQLDCSFGSFGKAQKEVADATGVKEYNFRAESVFVNSKGVMNEDGTKITIWGMANKLEEWVWVDDEMIQRLKDDRDPYDAPRYSRRPKKQ